MTDRPTNRQTDMGVHREDTLPIMKYTNTNLYIDVEFGAEVLVIKSVHGQKVSQYQMVNKLKTVSVHKKGIFLL